VISSKIILGTVQFGLNYGVNNLKGKPEINEIYKILNLAAEHGINVLDTADAYGDASDIIGSFHRKYDHRFLINSKFRVGDQESLSDHVSNSLEVLGVDYLNVYFYHSYSDAILADQGSNHEFLGLKKLGKVKKIGLSVYDNDQFRWAVDNDHIDVIQLPFNLLDNYRQRGELLQYAKKMSKEIQVRSVFLQGLFFKPFEDYPEKLKPLIKYVKEIQDIASGCDLSVGELALAYTFSQSEIHNIIIGVDNKIQLENNIKDIRRHLPEDVKARIDEIHVLESELLYPYNW
jgi:aryl-alcohol dehydrogenase-like predicted oxidoreductase